MGPLWKKLLRKGGPAEEGTRKRKKLGEGGAYSGGISKIGPKKVRRTWI